ncbi:histone-lysine N-methyltransferase SETMAR [Elysia marginata]|uniref:Histone-lysine N-methyltransferase SETMAR n=1 Tax=Elysia marginata TaxID=1093978 RepID=A0AAV4H401_9GAST|nr:histone-lysine N-methyltransferase SETMAR [Elysia marginata]
MTGRKTCEEISTETSMSRTSVFRVLTNKLNKKKFSKWVPHLLTDEHKESRVNFSRNFLWRFKTKQNDFLVRIVTGDETWVYSWDPERKRQSAERRGFDEPRSEKVRRKQGALKVMHMIFFYMNGVILRWPVPIGTTINAQYYKKVLQDKLRPAIRKKRPGLLESGILFHHDNAPVHTARAVTDVLAGYKWELLEHPRYSPDLAPCDFHLFPKMKEHLRGQRFETEEDIIQATKVAIKKLDKCSYVTAFKDWLQRIEKCANNASNPETIQPTLITEAPTLAIESSTDSPTSAVESFTNGTTKVGEFSTVSKEISTDITTSMESSTDSPTAIESSTDSVTAAESATESTQNLDSCPIGCTVACINITTYEAEAKEKMQELLEDNQKRMFVDTASLSKQKRKKTSATDERPSSQATGAVAISILVTVFLFLITGDIIAVTSYLIVLVKDCR